MNFEDEIEDSKSVLSPQRLFHILVRQLERDPEIKLDDLIRITVLQICRPGQVGLDLNQLLRLQLIETLKKEFEREKEVPLKLILRDLANTALLQAEKLAPKSISARARQRPLSTEKQLAYLLKERQQTGPLQNTDVKDIATQLYKRQRKNRQGLRRLQLEKEDPLRKIWGFEDQVSIDLPSQDVRHKMLDSFNKVKNRTGASLTETLRAASVFRPELLKAVLGDYWQKGQPVGFVDKRKTTVLFRVVHSADAQELMYQTREIIECLKAVPGFAQIKKVRFEVKS